MELDLNLRVRIDELEHHLATQVQSRNLWSMLARMLLRPLCFFSVQDPNGIHLDVQKTVMTIWHQSKQAAYNFYFLPWG